MSVRIFGSGGGVITDATANPEDVISGQIFYNNDGQQVGTLDITSPKTKQLSAQGSNGVTPLKTLQFAKYSYNEYGELTTKIYSTKISTKTDEKIYLNSIGNEYCWSINSITYPTPYGRYSKYTDIGIGIIYKSYSLNIPLNRITSLSIPKYDQSIIIDNLSDQCAYFYSSDLTIGNASVTYRYELSGSPAGKDCSIFPVFSVKNYILKEILFMFIIPGDILGSNYKIDTTSTAYCSNHIILKYF